MELITNYLYQVLFTVGIIVIFGLIISLCRRLFCRLVGRSGPVILLVSGIVGTPVHELSHALACVVFGHKIREIKLYRPNLESGTLGYVTHTFNSKNIYHQIGNFFIGIAPILGGSGILMLLMFLMLPGVFAEVSSVIGASGNLLAENTFGVIGEFFGSAWHIFLSVFDFSYANAPLWWVFIVLSLMISSHMELSSADIKGGIKGLLLILALLLAIDTALFLIYSPALIYVTLTMTSFGLTLASFLLISGIFSIVMLVLALVIKVFSLIFKK